VGKVFQQGPLILYGKGRIPIKGRHLADPARPPEKRLVKQPTGEPRYTDGNTEV